MRGVRYVLTAWLILVLQDCYGYFNCTLDAGNSVLQLATQHCEDEDSCVSVRGDRYGEWGREGGGREGGGREGGRREEGGGRRVGGREEEQYCYSN